jgi:ABC-type transport system involved in multi-copper enzyme maturation permease subunit
MPIYAPTLPPRPALDQGLPPALVIARFDLRRVLKQRMGRFFGFMFVGSLLVQLSTLYLRYLLNTSTALREVKGFANQVLSQGPEFHASILTMSGWLTSLLWFQVALIGGGLVARDSLYRIRPLMYAHPVRPLDYLLAKGIFAAGLPFVILLPFVFLPWGLSMLIAGANGPILPWAPLFLFPAALLMGLLIGAVTVGASSLAASPRAGFGWVLGIYLGTYALGGLLSNILHEPTWMAISPQSLVSAWPELLCGVAEPKLGWVPTTLGTLAHIVLWTLVAARRTRPSEAVI